MGYLKKKMDESNYFHENIETKSSEQSPRGRYMTRDDMRLCWSCTTGTKCRDQKRIREDSS
jgi:hypothetical protein